MMEDKSLLVRLKELYLPSDREFARITVPDMQFAMIDGEGDPGDGGFAEAARRLFSAIAPIKRLAKERMGKDFVEAPLEALIWADDMDDFVAGHREKWKWRLMIVMADWVDEAMFNDAMAQSEGKLGKAPSTLRLARFHEGEAVQIMHIGSYEAQGELLTRLYRDYLPDNGLTPNGCYHEIYLNDPNKVAPEKRKTVLRQPVRA